MESQEDSIDIAKLQRVALGLAEHETSQPQLDAGSSPASLFKNNIQCTSRKNKEASKDGSLPTDQDIVAGSPLKPAIPDAKTFPELYPTQTNNVTVTKHKQNLSQQEPLNAVADSLLAKMSSADSAPGDTQPVSQSAFDSIMKRRRSSQGHEDGNPIDLDSGADGATLATFHEGDTGHIDLLSAFGETQAGNHNSDQDDETSSKVGESSPLHYQPNLFPESQRFLASTPGTAKKQDHSGVLQTTTPSLPRNPLAPDVESSGGIMALSQVFQATQAPSSPYVNDLLSGPMSDRPSPNIPIQTRPVATSLSSPFRAPPSSLRRGFTEPQFNYISMQESQAKRDRLFEERRTRSADNIYSGEQSDDDFDREPSFVERLNRQRKIDEETNAQLAKLTAPARPVPNKRGQQAAAPKSPPSGGKARKSRSGSVTVQVLDDETQGSTVVFQNGGTSEEETEQEDLHHPTSCLSQQQHTSTEEDKENYNGPSIDAPVATSSAHGRLSQALELEDSPVLRRTTPTPAIFHQQPASQDNSAHMDEPISSSQIINVRDSQPSPGPGANAKGNGQTNATPKYWDRRDSIADSRHDRSGSQAGPSSDVEKVTSSPVTSNPLLSSPPPSTRQNSRQVPYPRDGELDNTPTPRHRSPSITSDGSPTPLPTRKSLNLALKMSSQDGTADTAGKTVAPESKEKSSSMPSRVAETPMHRPLRRFEDTVPETRIPETSPNRIQNDPLTSEAIDGATPMEEDDELPPLYQGHREGMNRSRLFSQQNRVSERPFQNAKILSSPSGKQRRALTEIAADASPYAPTGFLDMDISLLTADDREFTSVVGFSPIPPRKKRRGNDGQNLYASDPIVPVTPRPASPRFDPHIGRIEAPPLDPPPANPSPAIAQVAQPEPTGPVVTTDTLQRRRPKPSRRAETVWEIDASPRNNAQSVVKSKRFMLSSRSETQVAQHKRPAKSTAAKSVIVHNNRRPTSFTTAESPDPIQTDTPMQVPDEAQTATSENTVLAPNQVFACWNGRKRAYYPATCFGTPISTAQPRYLVKFEDGAIDEVPVGTVKRLELRVGDGVKVDMPNVQKVTHVVRGFDDLLSPEELHQEEVKGWRPFTDIFGYSAVLLTPKQRKSLPSGGLAEAGHTIKVPMSRIYLDMILWNQLKDRQFSFTPGNDSNARHGSPTDRNFTPATPNSRLSRSIIVQAGLFSGMVFAVSYVDKEDAKSRVTKLIVENGGVILKEGFNELFEFPPSIPPVTPSKPPASKPSDCGKQFRLTSSAETLGFACLVADKHSRREKYMQALALNLPCLSGRWIEDCVRHNSIVDWDTYLLPAGESIYLNGATKSRILASTSASTARLTDTIAARPKLLDGQSVLLVMGRGKAEEKRKAYIFLTYALGASRVERVLDLKAAKAALMDHEVDESSAGWNWIYVDDHEEAAAKAMILGNSADVPGKSQSFRGGKKRKRSGLMESISGSDLGGNANRIRIVGNEFVCQSLILGKLFDE